MSNVIKLEKAFRTHNINRIPTDEDIMGIPLATAGEYEVSDKEVKLIQSRIYGLNKNNAAGRRWRTMRDGKLLLVWRIS